MAFKNGFTFQGTKLVDSKGEATPEFQVLLTTLFQKVAVANAPKPPALATMPYVFPIPKLTALGAAGSITIDYQGVVSAFTPPT